MKIEHALLLILVALCLLVGVVSMMDPPANASGLDHPEIGSMRSGGPGVERHGDLLWAGWAFGALQILLFTALLAFGGMRRRRSRGLGGGLLLGAGLYLGVWTLLMLAYRRYLYQPSDALFLAFPAPTAWMLFGLWPIPLVFLGLYVWGFNRWIYTADDERRFDEILSRRTEDPGDE